MKQKGYVDTATQTAVHGISIHLVKDDPAMYPGRMPSAPPQQVVTAEAVVLSNDDDDHVNQYLPKAQVYDDF